MIVEWGLATKRAAVWPSTQLSAYWGAWFELSLTRRLPRCVFAPPPVDDGGLLRIVRRAKPLVPVRDRRAYAGFLALRLPGGAACRRRVRAAEDGSTAELGFDRRAQPRDLDAHGNGPALYRHRRPAKHLRVPRRPNPFNPVQ